MKEGDIVRHKISGERLKITKVSNERIVVGIWIDRPAEVPPWKQGFSEEHKEPQRAVCLIENMSGNFEGEMNIQFIVIDLFCGAGGTTVGFEEAVSKLPGKVVAKVVACVNHDPLAIESHWKNHPDVEHFEEDITKLYGFYQAGILMKSPWFMRLVRLIDMYRAFYPEALVILWASLECTNFSKAKGGLPRDADSRTLAEHLHPYITAIGPDYIKIENVVEFMAWGPLDDSGRPVSRKNGRDWIRWRQAVCAHGYRDEWRELNAADFGALTSRNRLFGCFARPGVPIVWPEPTHAKNPEKTTIMRPLRKWEPVKKALDFNDEGKSVFNRKKPLSSKTMQRLFMGCVKHIAGGKHAPTLPASRHHHYIINPSWGNGCATSADQPCPVVIARQDKAPLYLITCKQGPVTVPVYDDDCEWTVRLKEFMVLYDIVDIKMRMLKVQELKVIQGFPPDYILLGNQTDQKKFIGNAVHPKVPRFWIEAMSRRLAA